MNSIINLINETAGICDESTRKYVIDKLLEKVVSTSYATPIVAEKPAPTKVVTTAKPTSPRYASAQHSWSDYDIHKGTRIRNKKSGFVFVVTDEFARAGGVKLDTTRMPNRYFASSIVEGVKKATSLSAHDKVVYGNASLAYQPAHWIVEMPDGEYTLSRIKSIKKREEQRKMA